MNDPRLFVTYALGPDASVVLDRDGAHYLVSVMRRGTGDTVRLFNGRDGEWSAEIAEAGRKTARLVCRAQRREQVVGPDLELLFAPVKKARTDFIVEKATELGARRIRPVITARTIAERVRTDRMLAITREAAEQTERLDLPVVEEAEKLDGVLAAWPERPLFFCDEAGDARPMLEAVLALSHPTPTIPSRGGSGASPSPPGEGRGGGRPPSPAINLERARRMRGEPTDAEWALWKILRDLKQPGLHFRRQAVIGPYIADFACLSAKLIVEADGGQHGGPDDIRRDQWFAQNGYRVLRLWNNDIIDNPEGVWSRIRGFLDEAAHPTPTLPSRGGSSADPSPSPPGEGRGGGRLPMAASILIGPEGGFTPEERARIRALPHAIPVTLGPRILRADTAAVAALTLWQAACGDWS